MEDPGRRGRPTDVATIAAQAARDAGRADGAERTGPAAPTDRTGPAAPTEPQPPAAEPAGPDTDPATAATGRDPARALGDIARAHGLTATSQLSVRVADLSLIADAMARLRAEPGREIGQALLDQRNLAGIGTMWACESLFLEHLHPWLAANELAADALTAAAERTRRLMLAALPHAVQSTTGSRRPGENTYVHGRSGRPCRRCGATVRVAMIGPPTRERTMFYCPACQGGLASTDNGRPIAPLGSGRRGRSNRGRPS